MLRRQRPAPDPRAPRPPRQARSRATRERLLEAAEAIVAAKGCEEAGVAEVARRAGCSVGACYARFGDKRGLLAAAWDRLEAEAASRLEASFGPAQAADRSAARSLQALVRALVALHRERRGLLRAFAVEAQRDPALQLRRDRLFQRAANRLAARLRECGREVGHHHPERAAVFGLAVVWGAIEGALLIERLRAAALAPSDEDLAAELVRLLAAYLGVELV
jgi:AcrR family transcriptional regulator